MEAKAPSTFGPPETAVLTMIVTVMVTLPACGPFPSTLPPMMDRQLDMTNPAAPPWLPPSAMARVASRMLEWSVNILQPLAFIIL